MKKKSFIGLAILISVAILMSFSGKTAKHEKATFYVVCPADFHDGKRTVLLCVGQASTSEAADKLAENHNKKYQGHRAERCAGSCPGCN